MYDYSIVHERIIKKEMREGWRGKTRGWRNCLALERQPPMLTFPPFLLPFYVTLFYVFV